jgi:hypothetical protein
MRSAIVSVFHTLQGYNLATARPQGRDALELFFSQRYASAFLVVHMLTMLDSWRAIPRKRPVDIKGVTD